MIDLLLDCKILLTYPLAYRKRYKLDLEHMPTTKLKELLESGKKRLDLLLLGDSVTERVARDDQDQRTLFEMLRDLLPEGADFYHICHSAYYADIYLAYLRQLLNLGIRPDMVILPVNLRSFSPQWDYNPMFQNTVHLTQLLESLPQREKAIIGVSLAKKNLWQYLNAEVEYIGSGLNRMRHFLRIVAHKPKNSREAAQRRGDIFTFHYMNKVDGRHRKIAVLSEITRLCTTHGIGLLAYFTPINYQCACKYLGEGFRDNLKINVRTISEGILAKLNGIGDQIRILDFSTLFSPDYFFNAEETTEHLAEQGRLELCREILANLHVRN